MSAAELDEAVARLKASLDAGPTLGQWTRNRQLNGPFWHISSDHTVGGEPCKSGLQAVASVHGESKRGAQAYAAMFEANADWIAAANPATIRLILDVLEVRERKPLTVQQYNAIPELCAIRPSLYESIVRAIERAHGIDAEIKEPTR